MKNLTLCLIILVLAVCFVVPAYSQDLPVSEINEISEQGSVAYTKEEFDALSDNDKKDIYLNSTELLPENFDPTQYMDIFHQDDK